VPNLRLLRAGLLAALSLGLVACDDDSDDIDGYTPPPGKGALTVDNNTFTDIEVYVDGAPLQRVNDGKFRRYDLEPGVRRVLLVDDERDVRSYSADVDILRGRQTILDVTVDFGFSSRRFDVQVFLD
jgi:hypothetical protein